MKNEAGLRPVKRAFGSRKASVRFASWRQRRRFTEAARLLLHIRFANASLTKSKFYAIVIEKEGDIVTNDKLAEQSMEFAVQIINLVKCLKEQRESIISNQVGRSGTSIGANIREAKYAHGTADFISKMQIALKEASETGYWLELLYKTSYIDENQYSFLEAKCKSLRAMLVASINTAKSK